MPQIKCNGIDVYYEERGSGPPLLLIMGLGADGSLWEPHVLEYEKYFRCIIIDNRGAGRSGKPAGPYTTAMLAEDAAGVLTSLGINNAHIAGISMGGAIAQEIAIRHPELVKSLVLVCTWAKCDNYCTRVFEMLRAMNQTADATAFTRMLQLWIFTPSYHEAFMDDLISREESGAKNLYPMPAHAFAAQCDACIGHNTLDRLDRIAAPTLITAGDEDIFTPVRFAKILEEKIQGSELFVFKGGAHAHHWEFLEEFNSRTIEFMRRFR
ncbi:MAG: alpha/beta hydrolase [Oscillospiraceae bacterium]|nr:alpha/beta hydrolase [Oscillospiraceae bacterium]